MKQYYVIAAVVVAAFVALGASSLKKTMTPYVEDFRQIQSSTEGRVQAPGEVVKNTAAYDRKAGEFRFVIKDPNGQEMKVVYNGVKPGNFDQADRVVVAGKYDNGVFRADQLLVKCPSKYK